MMGFHFKIVGFYAFLKDNFIWIFVMSMIFSKNSFKI